MKCYPPKAEWHGEFPADGTVCLTLHQFAPFFFYVVSIGVFCMPSGVGAFSGFAYVHVCSRWVSVQKQIKLCSSKTLI